MEEKPGLFTATAPKLTGPRSEPVEDDYVDFKGNKKCEGVKAPQHGSFMRLTKKEYKRLEKTLK